MIPDPAYQARPDPAHRSGHYRAKALAGILTLLALFAPSSLASAASVWAIKNARISPVSGPVIEKGTVVLRNGLIDSVGANVTIPEDAQVIDGTGLIVYPGLIDSLGDLGLEESAPTPSTGRGSPGPPAAPAAVQERPVMLAHIRAADMLTTGGSKIENARNAGITTALVAPRRGVFAGQSALVNLAGDTTAKMIIKPTVALHILMETTGGFGGGYPGSLMGIVAYVRQSLLDAEHYGTAHAIYASQQRGIPRPPYNQSLEALQPYAKGQLPVVLSANAANDIERTIQLADNLRIKYILSGVQEGYLITALLKQKNVPLLISLRFPEKDRDADPDADEPLRILKQRAEAPANAAALQRAGLKFAFHSGQMANPRDFLRNAARAVQAGLPRDVALRALTLNAAEIFGVAEQLGSIEKGKIANLVVATGDLFAEKTQIKYVFIDGQKFEPKLEEPRKEEGRKPESGATMERADLTGAWNLQLETPQGMITVAANLRQQNDQISGTLSSNMGQAPIARGKVTGKEFRFTISFQMSGNQIELEFSGTFEGNNIKGSANSAAFGYLPFSGIRNPREEKNKL